MAAAAAEWLGDFPEDVEHRCAELARLRGPLRRALAAVAGRLVASRGWEKLGHARSGDYARVLEQHVRTIDAGSVEAGAAEPRTKEAGRSTGVSLAVSRDVSKRWQLGWRITRRVAGEALSPAQAAEWICAEVLSAVPLERDPEAPKAMTRDERLAARWRRTRTANPCAPTESEEEVGKTGLPVFLRTLVAGLQSADTFDLDSRLHRTVALEQRLTADLGPLLRRVATERLYRLRGYAGLEAYAEEGLGIGRRKAWALLWIERAARTCPALAAAYRNG